MTASSAHPCLFSLIVDGKDCSPRLLAASALHEIGRIPFLRATLSPGDGGAFRGGATVELKGGRDKADKTLFKGEVTASGVRMRGGKRLALLEARDKAHVLAVCPGNALFLKKSDAEVCRAVLSARGVGADIPATSPVRGQVQQCGCSDWDFVLARLRANGMEAIVRDGAVKAVKTGGLGKAGSLVLKAGHEALELEAVREHRAWLKGATAKWWNDAAQKEESAKASGAALKIPGPGMTGFPLERELTFPGGEDKSGMGAAADGALNRARLGSVRGSVVLNGLYDVRPDYTLTMDGLDPLVKGDGVVWAVRLEIAPGGCRTAVQFGHDFLEEMRRRSGSRPGAAAGLHPAKVLKISGDPEGGERVQVRMPLLHRAGEGVWARCAAVYAGNGRASVFRPEKDDEVLVGFLAEEPDCPVVLGALPSKAAKPPSALAAKDEKNIRKGFVSKSGIGVLFDEEAKSFEASTPGKQALLIDDKKGEVSLKDKNGNSLVFGKNGITLKSAKNIAVDAGADVSVKANKAVAVSGLDVKIDAKKSLGASGALGEVKASAMLTLKGGMVKIN